MAGYAATVLIVTLGMLLAAVPLARSGPFGIVSWVLSDLVNESPSLGFGYLMLATVPLIAGGDLGRPAMLAWFLVGCASFLLTPVLLSRSAEAREVLREALDHGLRPGWRQLAASAASAWRSRLPWARIALFPLPVFPLGVRRRRGLRYGPVRRNRLDVYRAPGHEGGRPVLIHLHGGGFRTGRKSLYARPLLHAFARHGWVCISASYRLRSARYVEMLTDVKRVLAWTRQNVTHFGGDPNVVVLAGSSAGAHLALTAALTANDRRFQPGFEKVDTSVAAAVGLYGYYGPVDRDGPPSQPGAYAHRQVPPIMIVHGAQDTLLPPRAAADLADQLRQASASPVVYAELPGAQHTFDLLHSLRFELVIDALWSFCASATAKPAHQNLTGIPDNQGRPRYDAVPKGNP